MYWHLILFVLTLLLPVLGSAESGIEKKLASALGTNQLVGASVVDLSTGNEVFSRAADKLLKPASVQKLLTSYVALRVLGPEFRFSTEVRVPGAVAAELDEVGIVGGGTPDLTIEQLWLLARRIRSLGITRIKRLRLDDSKFEGLKGQSGQRAYEAGAGALSLSFNSVAISVCPRTVGKPAYVTLEPHEYVARLSGSVLTVPEGSSPAVTVQEVQSKGPDQEFRVSGKIPAQGSCLSIYRSVASPRRYFEQVFTGFLRREGVQVEAVRWGTVPSSWPTVIAHYSSPLLQILHDLNHFSTNFTAEQLVYAVGQSSLEVWSREGGLERVTNEIRNLKGYSGGVVISDGSGLSTSNRLSARLLTEILRALSVDPRFSPEFTASLAVSDVAGTLKDRDLGVPTSWVRAKTGRLNDVSSLAGYIIAKSGRRLAFALIQNDVSSHENAHRTEEAFVRVLYESL